MNTSDGLQEIVRSVIRTDHSNNHPTNKSKCQNQLHYVCFSQRDVCNCYSMPRDSGGQQSQLWVPELARCMVSPGKSQGPCARRRHSGQAPQSSEWEAATVSCSVSFLRFLRPFTIYLLFLFLLSKVPLPVTCKIQPAP